VIIAVECWVLIGDYVNIVLVVHLYVGNAINADTVKMLKEARVVASVVHHAVHICVKIVKDLISHNLSAGIFDPIGQCKKNEIIGKNPIFEVELFGP